MNMGDVAVRSLLFNISKETMRDRWTLGYFRGQLNTINLWLEPNDALVAKARCAIDEFSKGVPK